MFSTPIDQPKETSSHSLGTILGDDIRHVDALDKHLRKCATSFILRETRQRQHVLTRQNVQRRAVRFCRNDYTSREAGCVRNAETVTPTTTDNQTNKQTPHHTPQSHLSVSVYNLLQPVQRLSRYLNNKAFNTIHASKNCYNVSYFPRTTRDWKSLAEAIVDIPDPQHFRQALIHD